MEPTLLVGDRIFVSTDCKEISEIALEHNVEVIKRPLYLAQDDSPEWLAWQHAIKYVESYEEKFDRFLIQFFLQTISKRRNY